MIDKRVIERQIRKGKLDAQAYRRTLEALPDVSDRVARDTDVEPVRSAPVSPPEAQPEPPEADDDGDDGDDGDDEDGDDGEETPSDASSASY